MEENLNLGDIIRETRKDSQYTQQQLALLARTSQFTVSKIETSAYRPPLFVFKKLCIILNLDYKKLSSIFYAESTDSVGSIIKQARIKAGLSQEKLSVMLNTTQGAISYWECGKTVPNKKTLQKICLILQLDFQTVMALRAHLYNHQESTLGECLKYNRVKLGFFQKEVEEILGLPPDTITRWETDVCKPNMQNITRICNFFYLDVQNIIRKYYDPSYNSKDLGSIIKNARIDMQLTQKELAMSCGISKYWLFLIEQNREKPNKKLLEKLCEVLDLDFEELNNKFFN